MNINDRPTTNDRRPTSHIFGKFQMAIGPNSATFMFGCMYGWGYSGGGSNGAISGWNTGHTLPSDTIGLMTVDAYDRHRILDTYFATEGN